jgi:hypothetical protein
MYDKHGCVLQVETVINDPYEFKVRRRAGRRGRRTLGWHPLPKGVAFLPRYATVSAAANQRYLDALAVVDDPAPAHRALDRLLQPVRDRHGRSSRAFNPAASRASTTIRIPAGSSTRSSPDSTPGASPRGSCSCARARPEVGPAPSRWESCDQLDARGHLDRLRWHPCNRRAMLAVTPARVGRRTPDSAALDRRHGSQSRRRPHILRR